MFWDWFNFLTIQSYIAQEGGSEYKAESSVRDENIVECGKYDRSIWEGQVLDQGYVDC